MTTTTATTEMIDVALDRITPNPWQPRQGSDPEYIAELEESIYSVGSFRNPCPRRQDAYFQLAFGTTGSKRCGGLHAKGKWGLP